MSAWHHHQFFWCCVSLVKFSYWSKCDVSIISSSRILTIFVHKSLTRILEIGYTPVWVLSKISRDWDELRLSNLAGMSLMKSYLMLQNARFTAFAVSEWLRENQQGCKRLLCFKLQNEKCNYVKVNWLLYLNNGIWWRLPTYVKIIQARMS